MSIQQIAAEFSRRLRERERAAITELLRAWAIAYGRIEFELDALLMRIEAAIAAGETVTESWLWRKGRLEDLLIQSAQHVQGFADYAGALVGAEKIEAVEMAIQSSRRYVALPRTAVTAPTIQTTFRRANGEALEQLVGTFSDGSPLSRLFSKMGPESASAIERELIQGVAIGKGPREVGRNIARSVENVGPNRATTIARTEQLRSYRSASIENYRANSNVIEGWVWMATRSVRTCPACWAMHGTEHPLSEPFASHPNCRCTPAPIVIGLPHGLDRGAFLFSRLPEAEQMQILGPSKFDLYRSGRLQLDDLVIRTDHPEWGPGIREASLLDLDRLRRAA